MNEPSGTIKYIYIPSKKQTVISIIKEVYKETVQKGILVKEIFKQDLEDNLFQVTEVQIKVVYEEKQNRDYGLALSEHGLEHTDSPSLFDSFAYLSDSPES